MQENNYLSYDEIAKAIGKSRQSISKKINKYKDFYKPYLIHKGKRTYISKEAIDLLKNNAHNDYIQVAEELHKSSNKVAQNSKTKQKTSKRKVAQGCEKVAEGCEQVADELRIKELEQELKEVKEELKKTNAKIMQYADDFRDITKALAFQGIEVDKLKELKQDINNNLIEANEQPKEKSKQKKKATGFANKIKQLFK